MVYWGVIWCYKYYWTVNIIFKNAFLKITGQSL